MYTMSSECCAVENIKNPEIIAILLTVQGFIIENKGPKNSHFAMHDLRPQHK